MSEVNFDRLTANWAEWGPQGGLAGISVSTGCDDCQILFSSNDYSVHLRNDDVWWRVDTVNDRGQRQNDVAKFSTFGLAEKYLIWDWVTLANSSLASGPLGADVYRQGYASGVAVSQVDDAHIKVCLRSDCAILVPGTAEIFSHIMLKSVDDIEHIGRNPVTR